jgi:hypothetical protein
MAEAHIAGHSTHFLRRLDRLADAHVELALVLYRDAELLKEVLALASVPEGAERVAISLDDPVEGPFVVVTRAGAYVTCLARGMATSDPVVTRERLDVASARVERMRERMGAIRVLESGAGEAGKLVRRFDRAGPILAREDFEALARWEPLLGYEFLMDSMAINDAMLDAFYALTQHGKLRRGRHEALLEEWWYAFWSWSHRFVLMHVGDAHARGELVERIGGVEARIHSVLHGIEYGIVSASMRTTWAVGRQARALLPALKKMEHERGIRRIGRTLALAAVAHASKRSRAEARHALLHPDPASILSPEDEARLHKTLVGPLVAQIDGDVDELALKVRGAMPAFAFDRIRGRETPIELLSYLDVPPDIGWTAVAAWENTWIRTPIALTFIAALVPWLAQAAPEELFPPREWAEPLRVEYSFKAVEQLYEDLRLALGVQQVETVRKEAAPGRNDPCTCGSGKKYKRCCGA